MPYFLKRPFSWAMTIGEQSVSAIIPKFMEAVSGASLAKALPTQPFGKPAKRAVAVRPRWRNWRRVREGLVGDKGLCGFMRLYSAQGLFEDIGAEDSCGLGGADSWSGRQEA